MKATTLFSAIALASAVVALPQASYNQQPEGSTNVDACQGAQQQPNAVPQFSGGPEKEEHEADAVHGSRVAAAGCNANPRPQSYGQNNNLNVGSNGKPLELESHKTSPQQGNRQLQGSTNNVQPQGSTKSGNNQPEGEKDDQPDDEDDADKSSPQHKAGKTRPGKSGTRPGKSGTRPGSTSAQPGSHSQKRPSFISGGGSGGSGSAVGGQCVSKQEAHQFVRRFIGILDRQGSDIGDAKATAEQIIADDFFEITSSIDTLDGEGHSGDTNSTAAKSKQGLIDGMLAAPPFKGIKTLKVLVLCDQVVWYWSFASVGSCQSLEKGSNLFTLRRGGAQESSWPGPDQIRVSDSGSGSIGAGINGPSGGSSKQGAANIQIEGPGLTPGGSSRHKGGAKTQGQNSGSSQLPPSGQPGPGAADQVPTGSTIQAVKLEIEFDAFAKVLDTGSKCTDRDGNKIDTSGGRSGTGRPDGASPQSYQGGSTGMTTPQHKGSGSVGKSNPKSFEQSLNYATNGQAGAGGGDGGGGAGGSLDANRKANSAGGANSGSANKAGSNGANGANSGGSTGSGPGDEPGDEHGDEPGGGP